MTLFFFPLLIIFIICGIALLLKNQIASTMTNPEYEHNLLLAQQQLEKEYESLLQQYLYTPKTLEYIPAAIPDPEIKGVLACKKQTSIAESMLGGVVTTLSGFAKIEHDLCYYLVMGKNTLYNFQYNIKTKRGKILKQFPRSEILTLRINKATFFDDLKQPKKFKLQDGTVSGDGTDNSQLKKLSIELADGGKEEFFCYEILTEGKLGAHLKKWGSDLLILSKEDILSSLMATAIPKKTFEKLAIEYNGTIE